MVHATLRWLIPLAALLILGPIAGLLTATLHAPDGGADATPLLSDAPFLGILAVAGAIALAVAAGSISARLFGASAGFFCAGLILAWATWGTGSIDEILRRTQSGSVFWTLAVEGAIIGVLGCLGAAVIAAFARDQALDKPHFESAATEFVTTADPSASAAVLHGVVRQFRNIAGTRDDDDDTGFASMAIALVLAVAAAGVGAWLLAQESLKGQTFAAAVVAGILAAGIGHAGDQRARATLFFAAMALLAVAAPLAAAIVYSEPGSAVRAAYAGSLLPPARILPLDWLAGAFIGIPIGLNWAASMLEKPQPAHA